MINPSKLLHYKHAKASRNNIKLGALKFPLSGWKKKIPSTVTLLRNSWLLESDEKENPYQLGGYWEVCEKKGQIIIASAVWTAL